MTTTTSGAPTIAVSGASGLIGRALVTHLRARGHTVRRLVREASARDASDARDAGDIVWSPSDGRLDAAALHDVRAVIHLAGEPIAHRWTAARRTAIRDSRVQGTALLARAIAALPEPPVFLSGSAVGYYGDRGDELLDETSGPGRGFLATVCQEWEAATEPASRAGARVVLLRTGVVLDAGGGALAKLLPPFRLGMGGPVGGGHQYMSWIALEDHVRAIVHALDTTAIAGPVNLVAPSPATNADFARTLGVALARPALVPVPAMAVELLFGEMARETILAGQRALPRVLQSTGFAFRYPTLEQAVRHAIAR